MSTKGPGLCPLCSACHFVIFPPRSECHHPSSTPIPSHNITLTPFFPTTCPYCQGCSVDISTPTSQGLLCLGAIERCQGPGRASLRCLFFPCGTQLPCLHPPELRRSKQPVPEPGACQATPSPPHGPPAACGPAVRARTPGKDTGGGVRDRGGMRLNRP